MKLNQWNKKAQLDFIDTDIFYEPAYWIIVALAIVGLAFGFGMSGFVSSGTGAEVGISTPVKALILVFIFPIAYLIVKIMRR